MGSIWIMILVVLFSDGKVKTELQWPQKSEYNTEASCNENAEKVANALQLQLGLANARVLFQCQSVSLEDLAKLAKKPGTDL